MKLKGSCKSSQSQIRNQTSFTLTISWNLAKLVKIFGELIVRQPLTVQKQMGFAERAVRRVKEGRYVRYCRSQVWMKIGGRIPFNVSAMCEIIKTNS